MNYYNENDPGAAAWLRALIDDKRIPDGYIDERSITEIQANDLDGFGQHHFFAGIGGWPYALELAGWPSDREVWTGSCPCQPFSSAGARRGTNDPRHLWPEFARLIGERKPTTIFGEQVSGKDGLGWLAGVRADLEAMGYAVGAADLCAASVGAPHRRPRLFWVGDADSEGRGTRERTGQATGHGDSALADGGNGTRNADIQRSQERIDAQPSPGDGNKFEAISGGDARGLPNAERDGRRTNEPGRGSQGGTIDRGSSPWSEYRLVEYADGKIRRIPVKPSFFPLANGVQPGRVVGIKGAGNAIVPQAAAEFVMAYLEVIDES